MSISKRIPEIVGLVALVFVAACDTLSISNPNDPDRNRALSDPNSIPSVAIGAFQTWYLTSQGGFGEDQYPALTMSVMARAHVAMWNNFNIRFYTGCTADWPAGGYPAPLGTCGNLTEGPAYPRVEWQNNLASAQRTQIEAMWYGYYSALSSANDALTAIRVTKLAVPASHMVETMSVLSQGLALSGIALNYDKGFIVDYNTDITALQFSTRAQIRDFALAKLDTAIKMSTDTFTVPTVDWFGGPAVTYNNTKIAKIANTMAARLLAYFPRSAAENKDVSAGGLVNWARVASYASKGISSGTSFNLTFHQDGCTSWCDFLKVWSNDMTTMRVHTRVAHMMDPASQPDPWDVTLNHNPASPDKRLGDGTSREAIAYDTTILRAYHDTNCAKPIGCTGGTDYVWTHTKEFGNKTRGAWHQSAVGQVRYDSLATCTDNPQGDPTGAVDAPMVLAAENDLLWAEALMRGPAPDLATAATLINKTRVGRGGLTPATAGDANLMQELQYEQDVELLGSNMAPFYNQRRIDGLEPLTPHEMPIPAQELGVLKLCSGSCYTWGGANNPPNSTAPAGAASAAALMRNAPQIWAEFSRQGRNRMRANRVLNRLVQ
jgi:starch-binding outer membrane protein, SusD/RagB family